MADLSNNKVVRAFVAVAASILAGVTAGASLARRPLVVTVDRPRRPYATRG